jgi:hypothetical protein
MQSFILLLLQGSSKEEKFSTAGVMPLAFTQERDSLGLSKTFQDKETWRRDLSLK